MRLPAPMIARSFTTRHVSRLGDDLARRLCASPRRLGQVHSVFTRAVNVTAHDDRLFTIQGAGPLAAPFAMSLDSPLHALGSVEPNMSVERVDECVIVGDVRLDWRGAARADVLVHAVCDVAPLAAALLDTPVPDGAPTLSSPRAIDARRRVARGIADADGDGFVRGALDLIGLGDGLTPAGDDCLVGVLAILCALRPDFLPRHRQSASALGEAASTGTTAIAGEFLLHALEGAFADAVLDLVHAPTEDAARRGLAALLSMGATSGADTVIGMRLSLGAITGR